MPGMILDCFCMILKMLLTCPGPSPPYGGVYFFLEIPFGLPWLLMFPWFSCQAAQGLHWFLLWSFMGFFASLWRHFSTWPVYMPLLSCFPETTITVPEHMPSSPYLCFCLFHFDITGHCCSSSWSPEVLFFQNPLPWCHLPGVNPSAGGMQLSPFCVCLGTWIVHPYYRLGVSLHSTSWCVFSWASC